MLKPKPIYFDSDVELMKIGYSMADKELILQMHKRSANELIEKVEEVQLEETLEEPYCKAALNRILDRNRVVPFKRG